VENQELKLKIFLKKGNLRKEVWALMDDAKTATDISKELGKHRSAISRVLIDMQKEGLIKCVNPEDSNFRHYVKK